MNALQSPFAGGIVARFLTLLTGCAAALSSRGVDTADADPPPAPSVQVVRPAGKGGQVHVTTSVHPDTLMILESASDVSAWQEIGRGHDALRGFPDSAAAEYPRRFYRVKATARGPQDDWKNQLVFPDEAFRAPGDSESVRWVKFAILLNDPARVYYQDSAKYPFHYDFATLRLPPFTGMSRAAFDAVSLRKSGQQVVLGTVLFPPRRNLVEYGVQFTGLDAYTPEEIARWFAAVKATVHAPDGAGALYMPTFEQSETARREAPAFEALGVPVASLDRWIAANHCYAAGWALGRLKFFPAAEIDAAFTDGRLLPADILLTDGVPAETPLVAGIISLTPSTPNSHTAILAQSFGIPFVHLPDAAERARVQALAGRKVILRATVIQGISAINVIDAEGILPAEVEADLLALKIAPPIAYQPKQSFGAVSASTDALVPADIRFFGGKAANYGLLRRTVPANCPPAVALSFDLWDAFMDQPVPGAQTLRAEIAARLAPHTAYPPQVAQLKTALAGIRTLITSAQFTADQRQAVIAALGGFDPSRKIRFRSSTNVEDSEQFTGAGLYDSYSGCLLDDLDGDESGPCLCDPADADERGVFRAIRKVYAGFYNDNAYLERLRHGVDESRVAMGVLVHHSFPDEEEKANGVATLDYRFAFSQSMNGRLVTQVGAESVTNPDGTALPEIVDAYRSGNSTDMSLRQTSSRLPLGAFTMEWQKDYSGFLTLFKAVGDGYRQQFPSKSAFQLDFEYKKDVNKGLVVKQVREIPAAPSAATTAFLVNDPSEWRVAQRETGDVFANHRLKCVWAPQAPSMRMTAANLAARGIYAEGAFDYVQNGEIRALRGPLPAWPEATMAASGAVHGWATGTGSDHRVWQLTTAIRSTVTGALPPVFTPADFTASLSVTYAVPVPKVTGNGSFTTVTGEFVVLEPRPRLTPGSIPVTRNLSNAGGVNIVTSFYWPDEPPLAGGYTAPLVEFKETRITGLTSQPITLKNHYSQTYRPGHHNFTEDFIFEPRLDPSVPAASLAELEAAGIIYIHADAGGPVTIMNAVGPDQKLRRL